MEFRPGVPLETVPITPDLGHKVGLAVAKIQEKLARFSNPALENRQMLWSLKSVPKLRDFTFAIENVDSKRLVHEVVDVFEEDVLAVSAELKFGIIHGDFNQHNILVDEGGGDISAVIDFGDMHASFWIFDLAVAICYAIVATEDVGMGKHILRGYQESRRLTGLEKKILKTCVCARLCQTLTLGLYFYGLDPKNEYVLSSQKYGWTALKKLWPMGQEEVLGLWEF